MTDEPIRLDTAEVDTRTGRVRIVASPTGVCGLAFADRWDRVGARLRRRFGAFEPVDTDDPGGAVSALRAYLGGALDALAALPLDLGGTPFEGKVWEALRTVPAGSTASYGEIAAAIGSPGAVRAVGRANGANPVWLAVPCHRIVRHDGALGGYGGGLDRKAWLLAHEGARPALG